MPSASRPEPAYSPAASTADDWQVICLCAEWCGTCRGWLPQLQEAAKSRPGVRFSWVDIEDMADVVGDVDIETFPTLLIGCNGHARFFGPVLPTVAQIGRLLASLQDDSRAGVTTADADPLLHRLNEAGLELI